MAVENPMSLVITSDTTIGVTLEASVPTTETQLFYITGAYLDKTVNVTIPAGVKVVCADGSFSSNWDEGEASFMLRNTSTNKIWCNAYGTGSSGDTTYVGVTAGKTYSLRATSSDDSDGYIRILYSQAINNKTPSVTDY